MERDYQTVNYYEPVLDNVAAHEETLEMIVPDALPDILRIVQGSGLAYIKDKSASLGRVDISGSVKVSVLYVPEDGSGPQKLEMLIPFSRGMEAPGVTPESRVEADAQVQFVEARAVNPRKVSVRAVFILSCRALEKAQINLCRNLDGDKAAGIETLKKNQNIYVVSDMAEKRFNLIDQLELPSSSQAISDIIKTDVALSSKDVKTIGNKVVFKGTARVRVLYFGGPERDIFLMENELPFSQIMELENASDTSECAVKMSLAGVDLNLRRDSLQDGKTIDISLHIDAYARTHDDMEVSLITDMYGTTHDVKVESLPYRLIRLVDKSSRNQLVREILDAGSHAEKVLDAKVFLNPVNQRLEDGRYILSSDADVSVLYLGEDGEPYLLERRIPVASPLELAPENDCDCELTLSDDVFASVSGGGVEIRFGADFNATVTKTEDVPAVCGYTVSEEPKDLSGKASVSIVAVPEKVSLWNIAKLYNTTIGDILAANGLESEDSVEAGFLLIPKKR